MNSPAWTSKVGRSAHFFESLIVPVFAVLGVLDASKAMQKAQAQLHVASEGLHQAVEGWSAVESSTAVYLGGRSHELLSSEYPLPPCRYSVPFDISVPLSHLSSLCLHRLLQPERDLQRTFHVGGTKCSLRRAGKGLFTHLGPVNPLCSIMLCL